MEQIVNLQWIQVCKNPTQQLVTTHPNFYFYCL